MEDKFDKYLKQELNSVENEPISHHLWDKERTWTKIATGLKPKERTISINWLYLAASLLFIVLIGSVFYHKNYTPQISALKKENRRLTGLLAVTKNNKNQSENTLQKIHSISVKNSDKKGIAQNSVYVQNTIAAEIPVIESRKEQGSIVNLQSSRDSVKQIASMPVKKKKLVFVIANEPNSLQKDERYLFASSKRFFPQDQDSVKPDIH